MHVAAVCMHNAGDWRALYHANVSSYQQMASQTSKQGCAGYFDLSLILLCAIVGSCVASLTSLLEATVLVTTATSGQRSYQQMPSAPLRRLAWKMSQPLQKLAGGLGTQSCR